MVVSPTEDPQPGSATATATPAVAEITDRATVYRMFREHFDARRFAEALPAAQRLVDLTQARFGPDASEMVAPLSNLGTTMLRLKDTNGAAVQFQRAVKIVEAHNGGFSREVIAPLFGLGVTYAAAGDYVASTDTLRRAVDVSRKLDGLFNVEQLGLVEALIASYIGQGQYEDAEREQQYALRLAESAYGRYDPRLIPMLERGARWLEESGRFIAARQTYARALEIARRAGGDKDPRMVTPLRGIARMYRLEYVYGAEPVGPPVGVSNPQSSGSVYGASTAPVMAEAPGMLHEAGEDALKLALAVLDAHPDLAATQRGDTLIDLGDWYLVAAKPRDAMRSYKEAWNALAAPGAKGTAALDTPYLIIYRPPSSSRRNPAVDAEEYTEGVVEVQFMVTQEGRVKDPTIATSDVTETVGKSVVTAIRRARYRPRFVDGAPVQTTGVRHRQTVYVRTSKSSA
ncbi:MAG TPA: TonB family protein [Steroidobacteraceae bacterium]|nr:TonB family protein [Steroidobacteraceae bacterium]